MDAFVAEYAEFRCISLEQLRAEYTPDDFVLSYTHNHGSAHGATLSKEKHFGLGKKHERKKYCITSNNNPLGARGRPLVTEQKAVSGAVRRDCWTVHCLQGIGTKSTVYIDYRSFRNREIVNQLLYTALSRASHASQIVFVDAAPIDTKTAWVYKLYIANGHVYTPIYIGSCAGQTPKERFKQHQSDYKHWGRGDRKTTRSVALFDLAAKEGSEVRCETLQKVVYEPTPGTKSGVLDMAVRRCETDHWDRYKAVGFEIVNGRPLSEEKHPSPLNT